MAEPKKLKSRKKDIPVPTKRSSEVQDKIQQALKDYAQPKQTSPTVEEIDEYITGIDFKKDRNLYLTSGGRPPNAEQVIQSYKDNPFIALSPSQEAIIRGAVEVRPVPKGSISNIYDPQQLWEYDKKIEKELRKEELKNEPPSLRFAKGFGGLFKDQAENLYYGVERALNPNPDAGYEYTYFDKDTKQFITVETLAEVPKDRRKNYEKNPKEADYDYSDDFYTKFGRFVASAGGMLDPSYKWEEMSDLEKTMMGAVPAGTFAAASVVGGTKLISSILTTPGAERALKSLTGNVSQPRSAVVDKLNRIFDEAGMAGKVNAKAEAQQIQKAENIKKAAKQLIAQTKSKRAPTSEELIRSTGQLRGELAEVQYLDDFKEAIEEFDEDEIQELYELIWNATPDHVPGKTVAVTKKMPNVAGKAVPDSKKNYTELLNNHVAIAKIFDKGEVPTPSELKRIENILGSEFARKVIGTQSRSQRYKDYFFDAWNAQKALIASIDLSAPGRQGWKLATGPYWRQYWGANKAMVQMLDPELGAIRFDAITQTIRENKHFDEVMDSAGDFFDIMELSTDVGRTITKTEDQFVSNWVGHIPGVALSERAYTGFLNKLRWDSVYKQLDDWTKQGYKYTKKDVKDLAEFINWSTGRGTIPKGWLGPNGNRVLNAGFFSPRFALSIPQFYYKGIKGTGGFIVNKLSGRQTNQLSKIHAKVLVHHVIKGMGVTYGIAQAAKLRNDDVEITTDPRKSDFGKVRIGPARYDFWGGDAQIAKFIARLATQERVSRSDIVNDSEILAEFERFIRSKMAPTTGMFYEQLKGEDFLGNEVTGLFNIDTVEEVREEAIRNLTTLFVQDVVEQIDLSNKAYDDPALLAPGILGFGVGIYETEADIRNELAIRDFGMLFDELVTDDMTSEELAIGYQRQLDIKTSKEINKFRVRSQAKRVPMSTNAQFQAGMELYQNAVNVAEQNLLTEIQIINGMRPEFRAAALDTAIRQYTSTKSDSYQSLFGEELESIRQANLIERGTKEDLIELYRNQYWDQPLPRNATTGVRDYEEQTKRKEKILDIAYIAHNIPKEAITTRRPSSTNPEINRLVESWRSDNDTIRTKFYAPVNEFLKSTGYYQEYLEYRNSPVQAIYKFNEDFNDILKAVRDLKELIRQTDPSIEIAMYNLGQIQVTAVKNPIAQQEILRLMTQYD